MSREMALAAYRHLLRSIHTAFQGDVRMLLAARYEARQKFEQGRALSGGSSEATQGIEHAEGVALILRQNVVQGQSESGEGDRFRLRIHEHTERGDNDTVQGGGNGTLGGVKCG